MTHYLKKNCLSLGLATLFAILNSLIFSLALFQMGRAMDAAVKLNIPALGGSFALSLVGILLWVLFSYLTILFVMRFSCNCSDSLRRDLFQQLYSQKTISFLEHKPDYYLNVFNGDSDLLRREYFTKLPALFNYLAQVVVFSFALLKVSPWLFGLSFVFALLPFFTSKAFGKPLQNGQKLVSTTNEGYMQSVDELVRAYAPIKSSRQVAAFLAQFASQSKAKHTAVTRLNLLSNLGNFVMRGMGVASNVLIVAVGGFLIYQGKISVGELVASTYFITSSSDAVGNAIECYMAVRSTKPIQAKLNEHLRAPERGQLLLGAGSGNSAALPSLGQDLILKDFSFRFAELELYRNFSYTFSAGGCYALIGESGSGKSTLARILLKELDGYTGEILLGGKELSQYSEAELYEQLALVPQTTYIFKDSLFNNLTMHNPKWVRTASTYQALVLQLRLGQLNSREENDQTFDVHNLSGGERERIGIARGLLQEPAVMIFDEPTTGLDPENVAIVKEAIFALKGITRLVITHDWDAAYLARFDGVIRMEEVIGYDF